jgi:hypothetical protein
MLERSASNLTSMLNMLSTFSSCAMILVRQRALGLYGNCSRSTNWHHLLPRCRIRALRKAIDTTGHRLDLEEINLVGAASRKPARTPRHWYKGHHVRTPRVILLGSIRGAA